MSKRRKKKATGSGCAAPLVLILIASISATSLSETVAGVVAIVRSILLLIAAPLLYVVAVWLVVSLVRTLWRGRGLPVLKSGLDFTGTTTEYEIDQECRLRIESSKATLASLKEQGRDLQRRKDGYFAERSKLASDLNEQMKIAKQELEQSQWRLQRVTSYQSKRAYKYMRYRRDYYEIVSAVVVLAAVFIVSYFIQADQVERIATAISGLSPLPSVLSAISVIGGLLCGVAAAVLTLWGVSRVSKRLVEWQLKRPSTLLPGARRNAAEQLAKRYEIGKT